MKKDGIIRSLIKYHEYILYYAWILLKQRVAGNYLGFLWLLIQPLMFMLIYSFVVIYIFQNTIPNFNIFVLIGLNAWSLISRTIMTSSSAITKNKHIFEQVYFHKFVYPTVHLISFVYEFLIATTLVFVMMGFAGIPFTWHILEIVPVLIVTILFALGCGLIVAHVGVYLFDLPNILEFTLRFLFFATPIMWSFDRLDFQLLWVLRLNPAATLLGAFRDVTMHGTSPPYLQLLIIGVISCVLIKIGYELISKYEDNYARVI
jgi:ABC-type polysaccharide/polyol phosphate export permease